MVLAPKVVTGFNCNLLPVSLQFQMSREFYFSLIFLFTARQLLSTDCSLQSHAGDLKQGEGHFTKKLLL